MKSGPQPPCLRSPNSPELDEETLEAEQHAGPEEENDDAEPEQEDNNAAKRIPRRTMISIILRLKGL